MYRKQCWDTKIEWIGTNECKIKWDKTEQHKTVTKN